jgi:hypothetical protein
VSSVIRGMEECRVSASEAAALLGHEVKRSEDFVPSGSSPQEACLAGVRWADVVLLLLGERYGEPQPSGLSATHEEYREARSSCPVLAFVQDGVTPDQDQQSFIDEVRAWSGGVITSSFSSPEDLKERVVQALHHLELSRQSGDVDEDALVGRAESLLPEQSGFGSAIVCLSIAAGPDRQILRPAEIESQDLRDDLLREALFGPDPVFEKTQGTTHRMEESGLFLEQKEASIYVDQVGSIRIVAPIMREGPLGLAVVIQEDFEAQLSRILRYAGWVLDRVDPVARLSHVVPILGILGGGSMAWRTRAEHEKSPNTIEMPRGVGTRLTLKLAPAVRPRASLRQETAQLAEDFTVLGRRAYRR